MRRSTMLPPIFPRPIIASCMGWWSVGELVLRRVSFDWRHNGAGADENGSERKRPDLLPQNRDALHRAPLLSIHDQKIFLMVRRNDLTTRNPSNPLPSVSIRSRAVGTPEETRSGGG